MLDVALEDIDASDSELREQILRLEARIEELSESAERCRRIGQIARLAVVVGGIWIVAAVIGIVRLNAMSLVGSITLLIGGVVAFGSNSSTWQQVKDGISAAQEMRAALIGRMQLRVIADVTESD
jgi:hypothetical protein